MLSICHYEYKLNIRYKSSSNITKGWIEELENEEKEEIARYRQMVQVHKTFYYTSAMIAKLWLANTGSHDPL